MQPSSASPEPAEEAAAVRGHLDVLTHACITGWAWDGEGRGEPVVVIVTAGERVVARALADQHRGDLAAAGIGDGRHAFELILDEPLDRTVDQLVSARRESDGTHLDGSPRTLPGAAVLGEAEKAGVAALLATACDEAELDARLLFLAEQAEALHGRRAARYGAQQHGRSGAEAAAARQPRALVIDDAPPRAAHDAGSRRCCRSAGSASRSASRPPIWRPAPGWMRSAWPA